MTNVRKVATPLRLPIQGVVAAKGSLTAEANEHFMPAMSGLFKKKESLISEVYNTPTIRENMTMWHQDSDLI